MSHMLSRLGKRKDGLHHNLGITDEGWWPFHPKWDCKTFHSQQAFKGKCEPIQVSLRICRSAKCCSCGFHNKLTSFAWANSSPHPLTMMFPGSAVSPGRKDKQTRPFTGAFSLAQNLFKKNHPELAAGVHSAGGLTWPMGRGQKAHPMPPQASRCPCDPRKWLTGLGSMQGTGGKQRPERRKTFAAAKREETDSCRDKHYKICIVLRPQRSRRWKRNDTSLNGYDELVLLYLYQ